MKRTPKLKKLRPKLGVQPYYYLLALAEVIIAAGLALLLNWLLEDVLEFRLAPWLWVVVFGVILCAVLLQGCDTSFRCLSLSQHNALQSAAAYSRSCLYKQYLRQS